MKQGQRIAAGALSALLAAAFFTGCGDDALNAPKDGASQGSGAQGAAVQKVADIDLSNAKDGVYNAESGENAEYGHGKIAITITDHKITAATYFGVDREGNIKGEDYGKKGGAITDEQMYKKAQNALKANAKYGAQLVERQQPGRVDAIAGSTISYEQFVEAATKAMEEAKK